MSRVSLVKSPANAGVIYTINMTGAVGWPRLPC
jgi:hypothetical protein